MKTNARIVNTSEEKQGFLLFYVMGTVALLTLFGLVSAGSASLEARSAKNKVLQAQALAHAEAGIQMVKTKVEAGLVAGQSLSTTLGSLSVSAPPGIEFDTISSFTIVVPERIFQFSSVGRSGNAEVALFVQFLRKDVFQAGIFGNEDVSTQPNVSVYGYDSRDGIAPTAATSNGKASVGSNYDLDFGNNFTLDGTLIMGADPSNTTASCSGCYGVDAIEVGHVDPDPLGLNGGPLADEFARARISNNNSAISHIHPITNVFSTKNGDVVLFESGDYYISDIDTKNGTIIDIDASAGPVRFFVTGEVKFGPQINANSSDPFDFQIYSNSTEDFRIQPKGDMSAFVYAPNAEIGLWPNGNMMGAFWGHSVQMQPGGDMFIDTSILDRWLRNDLVVHARFEKRSK